MKSHTPESLSTLRQSLKDYLYVEGYRPSINNDGEVMFHFEGKICYIQTAAADSEYVRLVIVNFRSISSEEDRLRVTAAAQEATGGTKVIKIFTVDGDTWCTAELLLPEPEQLTEIISRTLSAIRAALRTFEKSLSAKS